LAQFEILRLLNFTLVFNSNNKIKIFPTMLKDAVL